MATSKTGTPLSPVVVFLLGAASASALLLFFLTSSARPELVAGVQRRGEEVPSSASVRCRTPEPNATAGAEQHAGATAPSANEVMHSLVLARSCSLEQMQMYSCTCSDIIDRCCDLACRRAPARRSSSGCCGGRRWRTGR